MLFNAFVRSKLEYASIIWSPEYDIHKQSVEKVQRNFVKYLWYRNDGTFPVQGFPQKTLLDRFSMNYLATRRKYYSIVFLYKILHNIADCPELLSLLNFYAPAFQTRCNTLFYLSTPRSNILVFSPIYMMIKNYQSVEDKFDLLNCNIPTIKKHILNQT